MLARGSVFHARSQHYAQPMPTQAKLTRLRTRVTGLRRRGG